MNSRKFFDLLRRTPPAAAAKKIKIRDVAVLVGDSSGFTRKTHRYGILRFLSVMTRCYDRLIPILRRRRGKVLSHDADDILAVFDDASDAVEAAVEMNRWLRNHNRGRSDADRFNVCIGIHFGPVVYLSDDVYGDAVNVACKIGEELADKDEILVTRAVHDRTNRGVYARTAEIGGRVFELFLIRGGR